MGSTVDAGPSICSPADNGSASLSGPPLTFPVLTALTYVIDPSLGRYAIVMYGAPSTCADNLEPDGGFFETLSSTSNSPVLTLMLNQNQSHPPPSPARTSMLGAYRVKSSCKAPTRECQDHSRRISSLQMEVAAR